MDKKTEVKIFTGPEFYQVEQEINDYIADKQGQEIEIKYSTTVDNNWLYHSAMVILTKPGVRK